MSQSRHKRRQLFAALVLVLLAWPVSGIKAGQAQAATRTFPQTGKTVSGSVGYTPKQVAFAARNVVAVLRGSDAKLRGQYVLYFAGWRQHYSLYPAKERLVAAFKDELAPYKLSKGAIRFQADEPLPVALVRKLVKARIAENARGRNKSK